MATNKRVFTLRLSDEVFDKIGALATRDHRSITNYIEYVLLSKSEPQVRLNSSIQLTKSMLKPSTFSPAFPPGIPG